MTQRVAPGRAAPDGALAIAVLAKAPVAGLAKTRLAPALGAAGAAALAERLLRHAVQQAADAAPGALTLWCTPDTGHPAFQAARARHGLRLAVQGGGDLGRRMAQALAQGLAPSNAQGARAVLLIGTDMPALDAAVLRQAAAALSGHDAVFVPAHDGGYGLVGLADRGAGTAAALAALFDDMPWSTPQVMALTRRRLAAAGLRHAELSPLHDIDEPADLAHLPPGWIDAAT